MNIKHAPCLARIVAHGDPDHGKFVEVLRRTPEGDHVHPDGILSEGAFKGECLWLCKSLMHSGLAVPGFYGRVCYADIADELLRPLPGLDEPEHTTEDVPEGIAA